MANTITLYSISELLDRNFFIPSYQRGYRWDEQQVEDLLNDIYSFALKPKKSEKEFYCLQPIVVKKCNDNVKEKNSLKSDFDENVWYEVIDGQQRLTTIRLLISYLVNDLYPGKSLFEVHRKNPFVLEYETRKESKAFIEECRDSDLTIDYNFITNARKSITYWFNDSSNIKDPQKAKEKIRNTLIYNQEDREQEGIVQVIWYEINDENVNPIETFLRINLGKIPLTNGELVKALFLQNTIFGDGDLAEMQQVELANKWDFIERALRDEKFWWFVSNEKFEGSTRIDFILNLYYQRELLKNPDLQLITGKDKNQIFRFYNHLLEEDKSLEGVERIWQKVESLFDQINEWYINPTWYHYVGFLISKKVSVQDLLKLIDDEENRIIKIDKKFCKADLTTLLVSKISTYFSKITKTHTITSMYETNSSNVESVVGDKKYLDIKYGDGIVRDILLLYNLEYIVKHSNKNGLIYKFPFYSFKNLKNEDGKKITWDIEHIDSTTDKDLDNITDQKTWLNNALIDIPDLLINNNLFEPTKSYLENEKMGAEFENLYNDIKKIADEETNDEQLKNNIGNLTLLDSKTNRGYGNALFITKRRIIIQKDRNGTFIPQLTKNVFLKYTNVNNSKSHWTKRDIELYNQDILHSLSIFIKP